MLFIKNDGKTPAAGTTASGTTVAEATTVVIGESVDAEPAKPAVTDIKAEYLAKLNEECKTNNVIYNAYFYMNKGGNPILAYSNITEYDTWPTPDHVYQYINGEIVDVCFSTETGSAMKQDVFFVEGTNTMVFREMGNSGGTLGYAKQEIYIFDTVNNGYKIIEQEVSYDGEIVHYGNPSESDYYNIQHDLITRLDEMLAEKLDAGFKLVSYSESMVKGDCVSYLEGMLGGEVDAVNYEPEY